MVMTCIGRYSPIPSSRLKVSRSQGFKRLEDLSLRPLCLSKKRVSETAVCDAIGLDIEGSKESKEKRGWKVFCCTSHLDLRFERVLAERRVRVRCNTPSISKAILRLS